MPQPSYFYVEDLFCIHRRSVSLVWL